LVAKLIFFDCANPRLRHFQMYLINQSINWLFKQRLSRFQHSIEHPIETQQALLHNLIQKAKNTEYGEKFGYSTISTKQAFKEQVPLCTYEQLYPYIEKVLQGNPNILWPTPIKWISKSSGTTNDRSKFIPVSSEALQEGHYKAGKDMLAIYLANYPESQLSKGKSLAMAGSLANNNFCPSSEMKYGDVSAVIMQNLPFWAKWISTPSLDIALLENWEEKLEKLAQITVHENITALSGIPTWMFLLLNKILAIKQATNIKEVWPNLELFVHGGVAFAPYKDLFNNIISPGMHYMEVYNASEGFFAIQDTPTSHELLLFLDHGIYYEFIPIEELNSPSPRVVDLSEVQIGKIYALVISTNAGLWRYQIGDTIKFTSIQPYRIKIAGRTKHFINTFGEELVIDNAEMAIAEACMLTGATISEYTAGPDYILTGKQGRHEWLIEFVQPPNNLTEFVAILDRKLQALNSDYEAKRYKDLLLAEPIVTSVPKGVFYTWMKKNNKLGEQHKVPRLYNSRKYLDDIHQLVQADEYCFNWSS
jgi:hypothetical protein